MPSIPALPPPAPSFAQRLNVDGDRPLTPLVVNEQPSKQSSPGDSSSRGGKRPNEDISPTILVPPLPLVLRPPLRKKKSFSRGSNWLFPNSDNRYGLRMHSVTNKPRPLADGDGFYQCATDDGRDVSCSYESFDSLSTWKSNEKPTTATKASPEMTPIIPQEEPKPERCGTFGASPNAPFGMTVGMAL